MTVTNIEATERKLAVDALRASEAHLSEAQRIAHIGSWEINEQTKELIWSDEVYRMFGLRQEEFRPTGTSMKMKLGAIPG